ncbi:MAG: hypothetical protein CL910_01305 [Deltaproteobacteria bacterium]|nr:hypothetical protein [Deltaproteobacteria bacterium]
MDEEVEAIECAAFEAWPAAEVRSLAGWRLRFNHGVTQRGNSVWTGIEPVVPDDLGDRMEAVESFYGERNRPAIFQISPWAAAGGLDRELAARGYESASPVFVQSAACAPVAARPVATGREAGCDATPTPDWIDLTTRRGRYAAGAADVFLQMLDRLGERAGFAWAADREGPAASGLVVLAPPWAGIFAMRTLEDRRERGLGAALLTAMARWARGRGVTQLYLQVEQDNPAALGLYAGAGFVTRYPYHCRRGPAG